MATVKEIAYQRRAGLIAILHGCWCAWPEVISDTETGHDERCTAHGWLMQRMGVAQPELSPTQCCARDVDGVGSCDVHKAQGVLRGEFAR